MLSVLIKALKLTPIAVIFIYIFKQPLFAVAGGCKQVRNVNHFEHIYLGCNLLVVY